MGIKKIIGRTVAGVAAASILVFGVQHCGDVCAFFRNSGVVAKSFAATTISDAASYTKRVFTTDPGEYLDELRGQGKKLEDVLKANRSEIQSGNSDMEAVLQAIIDQLQDQRDLVRRYRTSEANLIEAEREVAKSVIEYSSLFELTRALDRAADLAPKYEADVKKYAQLQDELGKNPTPKKREALVREREAVRERLATTAAAFFEAYAAGEKARQELARLKGQRSGEGEDKENKENKEDKENKEKYAGLSEAVAKFAPYMERGELNALLDKAISSVTAFYNGEARYQRQNAIAQDFIRREMSAGDLYQADHVVHRRLDEATRVRRFAEEADAVGKLSKQARIDAIVGTAESLREASPEEWNALAQYLADRIPGEHAAGSVQKLLERFTPEQEAGLYAHLGNRIALRQTQAAAQAAQAQAQAYAQQPQHSAPAVDVEDMPERTLLGRIADFAKSIVE